MGETVYSNKDLSKLLGVKDSTLRKYCLTFEEQGYKFYKNEHGYRGFFEKDVIVFRRLIDIKNDPDITTVRAVKAVLSSIESESEMGVVPEVERVRSTLGTRSLQYRNDPEFLKELRDFQKRQEDFNQALLERLDQRDKSLLMLTRELLETRREIATTKQKKWWQFWK